MASNPNKSNLAIGYLMGIFFLGMSVVNYYQNNIPFAYIEAGVGVLSIILERVYQGYLKRRRNRKVFFLIVDWDSVSGCFDWPKNTPMPRIGEQMNVDVEGSRGFHSGFVYKIVHSMKDSVYEIRIHVGDYKRIAEFQKEQESQ